MKLKKIKWKDIFCLFLLSVMIGCSGGSDSSSQQGTGGGDGSVPANELSSFGIHGAYSPAPYFQQEMNGLTGLKADVPGRSMSNIMN